MNCCCVSGGSATGRPADRKLCAGGRKLREISVLLASAAERSCKSSV